MEINISLEISFDHGTFHLVCVLFYVIYSPVINWQTFGWTPQEAKMHMVTDYFSHSEVRRLCHLAINFQFLACLF